MLPTFITVMQVEETCLQIPTLGLNEHEPLFTAQRVLTYVMTGIHEDDYAECDESFWLITMTPSRYPIARQRLRTGHLVAARVSCREIFEAALLAGAGAIACARTQYGGSVQPGLADGRLLWDLHEAAKHIRVLLIDYLILQIDGCGYYAYSEHRRLRD